MDPRNQSPFNALPPVVVGLAAVIMGNELLFQAADAGLIGGRSGALWRTDAVRDWGIFRDAVAAALDGGTARLREIARFLAYPLIHGSLVHAGFVAVFVLALGNAIAPVYRGWRVAALFFGSALAAGVVYALMGFRFPLFGGFPGAYGLIGTFAYLTRRGLTRVDPSRAFLLIGFLLAIQPVFGLATGAGFAWIPDWLAEMTGAAAGYGLAILFFPGMSAHLLARLRQR